MTGCERFKALTWRKRTDLQISGSVKPDRNGGFRGAESGRCHKNEKSASLRCQCMGAEAGGNGYTNAVQGLRASGDVAAEAGGESIPGVFGK